MQVPTADEAAYRLLFDAHPLPTWVFALDGLRFLAVNEAAVRELGYSRAQFLAMTILDFRPPGDHDGLRAAVAGARRSRGREAESAGVWELLRADGRSLEAELIWMPVQFGEVDARMVVARDVTRSRRLEAERRAALAQALHSREQLQRTLRRVSDGFLTLDRSWSIAFANERARKLLALISGESEIIGRTVWDIVPRARDQSLQRACEHALATQQPGVDESCFGPQKQWFESRIYPDATGLSVYFTDITARREIQATLEQREQQYRMLFERHPNPMWVYDMDTLKFLSVNGAAVAHYGYTHDEFLAMTIADIRPDEDLQRLKSRVERSRTLPQDHILDAGAWKHRLKSGELIEVEITSSTITFDGRPARLVLALDVTERLRAERALRESERNFRLLAERMPGIVYRARLGPNPRTEYVSPRIADLGFQPEEWLADPQLLWQSIHPDDRERVEHEVRQAVRWPDRPAHFEYRMRAANGQWRYVSDHAQVVHTADGEPGFVLGVNIDITERHRAQQKLQQAQEFRRHLVEQLADGVLVLDNDLIVRDANRAACEMLGRDKGAVVAKGFPHLLVPTDRLRFRHELSEVLAGRRAFGNWELQGPRGQTQPVEVSARSLEDGKHLIVLRDVGHRRAAEAAQLAHQRQLEALSHRLLTQEQETTRRLAQALHDHLGQNLATARLFLDELQAAAGQQLPDNARAAAARVVQVIDDAIRQTRVALADLRPPALEERGLAAAIQHEIGLRHPAGAQPTVRLETSANADRERWPPQVEYAAFMVVREALANARLHARATSVGVHLWGDASELRVQVIDDGCGIGRHSGGRVGHLGIVGMRERALAIGAAFNLDTPEGGGTRVTLHWQR